MNLSPQTISFLRAEYNVLFVDSNISDVPVSEATTIIFPFMGKEYDGKSVRITSKKEVGLDYIFGKIESDKIYKSFASKFESILKGKGFSGTSVYPTTYGIGVFNYNYKGWADESKRQVSAVLEELGVSFRTELSDAAWVFRFVISKSAVNISKMQ